MPCEEHSSANSWEKVVSYSISSVSDGRSASIWEYFHRDVFCFYLILELQGLLCIWIYVAGFCDSPYCHHLRHYSWNILLAKCWKLSLAMDIILLCRINSSLCVPLFHILLLYENEDVWIFPDNFLFWLHTYVLPWFGNTLWSCWLLGLLDVC